MPLINHKMPVFWRPLFAFAAFLAIDLKGLVSFQFPNHFVETFAFQDVFSGR